MSVQYDLINRTIDLSLPGLLVVLVVPAEELIVDFLESTQGISNDMHGRIHQWHTDLLMCEFERIECIFESDGAYCIHFSRVILREYLSCCLFLGPRPRGFSSFDLIEVTTNHSFRCLLLFPVLREPVLDGIVIFSCK